MNKGVAEILEEAAKLETVEDRAEHLKKHNTPALQTALYYCYHNEINWQLPDTDPPYKPRGKEEDLQNVFKKDFRKVRMFVSGKDYDNIKPIKREMLFIEFIESLDPDDAKLILSIKNKKMPWKAISRHVAKKAFPELGL